MDAKNYGVNSETAYSDECEAGGKHEWVIVRKLGRCYAAFKCTKCGAVHRVDSSD